VLALASCSLLTWVLGNGIPYGYDSSGTYLTYRAAYNATTFPGEGPLVADVSVSPEAAAHPTYDLDRPNVLGQLSSQLLMRAGVSDLRVYTALAIAIAVFGVVLAVKVLTRLGGAALAATTGLLFALQYVGVLSWTTNLQTALYFPLFWGSIYLLERYVERPSRARLIALATGIAVVCVHDVALGAFVLLTVLFLAWQLPTAPSPSGRGFIKGVRATSSRDKLGVTFAAIAGAGVALAVLVVVAGPGVLAALLPRAMGDNWREIPSAYRALFGLGQGALMVLVYGVLLAELVGIAGSRLPVVLACRRDLGMLLAIALVIAAVLWLDHPSAMLDDWEPFPGRPIIHVALWLALVGLLIAVGIGLMRGRQLLPDLLAVDGAPDGLTARSFVVAVGLAALALSVVSVANFTDTFIRTYQPALVFLEDAILAAFGLALFNMIREAGRWSVPSVALAGVLLVLGSYWLVYQAKLAVRFPPKEIGVATALRGNALLAGADFYTPDLPQIVWYYTRGQLVSPGSGLQGSRSFAVCARIPADLPGPTPCERLIQPPGDASRSFVATGDYLIVARPSCGMPGASAPVTGTGCGPQPGSPPTLVPLTSAPNAPVVKLTVTLDPTASLAHVEYTYAQAAGTPESDSIVRLYVLRSGGGSCLLDETAGSADIRFPPTSAGQFRAAVIPRSTLAVGEPYFSEAAQVESPYVVDLPNTRDGGTQQIPADSLEDAEQKALAAGTWNPSAGTLGPESRHRRVEAPTADNLCRN
jgi:hypothetical protein